MQLVLDATAFVRLLLYQPGSERAAELTGRAEHLLAPDFILTETASALWKQVRWGGLPAELASRRLDAALRYPIELISAEDLLPDALRIACELPHPVYDSLYLLLALHGGRTLATADKRLRRAAEGLGIRVEWVGG